MVITYKLRKKFKSSKKEKTNSSGHFYKVVLFVTHRNIVKTQTGLVWQIEMHVIVLVGSCLLVLSRFSKEFLDSVNIGTVKRSC